MCCFRKAHLLLKQKDKQRYSTVTQKENRSGDFNFNVDVQAKSTQRYGQYVQNKRE